jgi:hypothetical protein
VGTLVVACDRPPEAPPAPPSDPGHWATLGPRFPAIASLAAAQELSFAQTLAFRALVGKLERAEPVVAVSLGGSMIAGEGCSPGPGNGADPRACAYPSRFARWVAQAFYGVPDDNGSRPPAAPPSSASSQPPLPESNFFFENRALGGTTTAGALPMLPLLVSDHRGKASPPAGGGGGGGGGAAVGADLVLVDFSVNDHHEAQDWANGDK